MKYIKFFFVVGLLCSFLDSASAQRLVVFSVSGGPQLVTTNGNTSIKAYDELTMESTINIPYDASLELLDETAKKHYVLKTPGRDKISAFVQNKKNGVGELSMRYFQYMQNQLKGGAKLAARRHSDPATVTREKQEYVEEDDWEKEFRDFTDDAREEYQEFRDQANKEYAEFMEEAWQSFRSQPAIPEPKKEEVKPLTLPQKERGKGIKSRPIQVEEFVAPLLVTPQPMPIDPAVLTIPDDIVVVDPYLPTVPMVITDPTISVAPIERLKIDPAKPQKPEGKEILYYGTKVYVRFEDECSFKLSDISEKDVAEGWETLSSEIYNNTIADCLSIRKQLRLSDWGYLQLLQAVGDACLGKGTNEATLLTAFIYCQSGYKMRLGRSDSQLVLLYGSRHIIYNKSYFTFNSDMFYALNSSEQQLMICTLPYPAEQGLSLLLTQEPILTDVRSDLRTLKSLNQPDLQAEVSVNKNLLDFYSNYPSSEIGGNMMSRCRMIVLFDAARRERRLVFGTTNRSELLMGYMTKFGDGAEDASPICRLYKTQVWEIARLIGVPGEIIDKVPTAGLWDGQTDEEEMGVTYLALDKALNVMEQGATDGEMAEAAGITAEKAAEIRAQVSRMEHKHLPAYAPRDC